MLDALHSKSDVNTASTSAQLLLQSLQNFVVPLIRAVTGQTERDTTQVPLGPEAEIFLTALQQFISSMIKNSQEGYSKENGIEVNLGGIIDSVTGLDYLEDASDWLWIHLEHGTAMSSDTAGGRDPLDYTQGVHSELWSVKEKAERPNNLQRLQSALQERIFGTMPIRVLHFSPWQHGSKLKITILDRNGIYNHLAAELEATYSDQWFQEKVTSEENDILFSYLGQTRQEAEDRFVELWVLEHTRYAILSHTWLRGKEGEVTLSNWRTEQFDAQEPGYRKLANFCTTAWRDYGLAFGWMDTVCINKDSSSELDESIRSMYKWYKDAFICITYLGKTKLLSEMQDDPWFTRGWTLQELLAPKSVKFYNMEWNKLASSSYDDNKDPDVLKQIQTATTITPKELETHGSQNMPISRKMQLAAKREVMREEDTAYSMMGICDVSISIAYGEGGERAFFRLVTEILNSSATVLDLFNCAINVNTYSSTTTESRNQHVSSLIPFNPMQYLHRISDWALPFQTPIEPLILTHLGLRTPVLLMPGLPRDRGEPATIGDYYGTVHLVGGLLHKDLSYNLFQKKLPSVKQLIQLDGRPSFSKMVIFGTLNFGGDSTDIHVPQTCLAVGLQRQYLGLESTSAYVDTNLNTKGPIVFNIYRKDNVPDIGAPLGSSSEYYTIKRSELEQHGMELQTLYL